MNFVLAVVVAVLLSACGQTKTQDYYLAHPDQIKADLEECQKAGKNTFNCNEAEKADWILKHKQGN